MARYFPALAGNDALRQRLAAEINGSSLSHAYIIEGPAGSGKHTLARSLVMALACQKKGSGEPLPCGHCLNCEKIAAGASPDVMTVARPEGKSFLSVDTIRELRRGIRTVPNDLPFKVYLIEDAHTMNLQAQNAFLLTLEEPPPFVLFLLLCEDASALLETIRSRAPIFRMAPVGEGEIEAYLFSPVCDAKARRAAEALKETSPAEFKALLFLSNGNIGEALRLLDKEKRAPLLARRETVKTVCRSLASREGRDHLLGTLLSCGSNREEATQALLILETAVRDLFCLSASESAPLIFFTDREEAAALAERFTQNRLLAALEAMDEAISSLAENANLRLTLTKLFNDLAVI